MRGTFQELQFSEAYLDNWRCFLLLFRVVLSLDPRLDFDLKISHLLRHRRLPVYFPSPECWYIYYITGSGRERIVCEGHSGTAWQLLCKVDTIEAPGVMGDVAYEGWNFNFGNTPLDWIQELLE